MVGGRVKSLARGALGATGVGQAVEAYDSPEIGCITFDDGPDPIGTTAVLEALRERDAKATFFVLGTRVRRYPELLREVLAEGHELAVHGADHRDLIRCRPSTVVTLVEDARKEIEDTAGVGVRWFRPPYVALHLDGWWALRSSGLDFVASGSAVHDWVPEIDDDERVARFRAGLTPGDVVLAHDAFAGPEDNAVPGPEPTVDRGRLCHKMLDAFEERGLRPVTMAEADALAGARTAVRVSVKPVRRAVGA